jgi:hypothetical protein
MAAHLGLLAALRFMASSAPHEPHFVYAPMKEKAMKGAAGPARPAVSAAQALQCGMDSAPITTEPCS